MVTLGGISPKVVAKCYKMIFGVQFFKEFLILQSVKFTMPWPQLNLYTPTNHCYAFNWRFSVPCLWNLNSLYWTPHYNRYRLQHMQYHPGVGWARIWKSMDDIYQAICCTFCWRLLWWGWPALPYLPWRTWNGQSKQLPCLLQFQYLPSWFGRNKTWTT